MKKVNNRPIIHLNHNKDESKVSFIDAIKRVEVTEFSVFLDGAESFIWFDDDFRNILKSLSDEKRKSVLEKISSLTMNHLRNCIKMKVDIDNGDIESIIRNVKTRVYKEEPYYFIMNNDIHTKLKEMVDRQIYLCTKDGETDLKFVVKTDGHGVAIYLTKKMGKKVKNLSDESRKEFEKMTVEKLKAIIKGSFLRGENISAEELMNHISHNLDLFKENQEPILKLEKGFIPLKEVKESRVRVMFNPFGNPLKKPYVYIFRLDLEIPFDSYSEIQLDLMDLKYQEEFKKFAILYIGNFFTTAYENKNDLTFTEVELYVSSLVKKFLMKKIRDEKKGENK